MSQHTMAECELLRVIEQDRMVVRLPSTGAVIQIRLQMAMPPAELARARMVDPFHPARGVVDIGEFSRRHNAFLYSRLTELVFPAIHRPRLQHRAYASR